MKLNAAGWGCAVLAGLWLAGCGKGDTDKQAGEGAPPATTETRPAAVVPAPTLDELKDATYVGIPGVPNLVTLSGGRWEGDAPAGGASRPTVDLGRDLYLEGDLGGDAAREAVVLLAQSSGGTSEVIHLVVMDRGAGGIEQVGLVTLGDRVQVRDVRIVEGRLLADVIQAGPSDPMCCPGERVLRTFAPGPDGLTEVDSRPLGRLGVSTLEGKEWVLRWWTWDEPAPESPSIRFGVGAGSVRGTSGCNGFFASVSDGASPGELSFGPMGGTRVACPDSVMAVETKFIARFIAVKKFSFMATRLALSYQRDGRWQVMLFEGRDAP